MSGFRSPRQRNEGSDSARGSERLVSHKWFRGHRSEIANVLWTFSATLTTVYIHRYMRIANSFHNAKPLCTLFCYLVLLHCTKSWATATNDKSRYMMGTGIFEQMEHIAWFLCWEPRNGNEREKYRKIKRFPTITTTYSIWSRIQTFRDCLICAMKWLPYAATNIQYSPFDSSRFAVSISAAVAKFP